VENPTLGYSGLEESSEFVIGEGGVAVKLDPINELCLRMG